MSNNRQQTAPDEATQLREMVTAYADARRLFPDEAFAQAFILARFLGDPATFAEKKRLLERVLGRRIGLKKPYSENEFLSHVDQASRTRALGTVIVYAPPTKH